MNYSINKVLNILFTTIIYNNIFKEEDLIVSKVFIILEEELLILVI